ncbi:MAG TPA: phosphatidylglycerol lysyltransferase domain-containing protein [Streptosporangiaceae bacterium]|nr:phosphatidylglycerol lysyltransferase domain-containing protein [Streptosporangiaceae bacterium]
MRRQLRGTAALIIRATAVILAIMLVTSMATGWLYWLRAGVAGWPGPRVADALPLDELPGQDRIPFVVCAGVFAVAGVMLGLLARALRLDRLTAGLTLAAGTGIWLFAVDAVSLLVVRQVPTGEALRAAARLQPVYLAAALAGAGGALLGRGARPGGMTPRLLGSLVAAGGLIDLVSALAPHSGPALGLLAGYAPYAVFPAAHVLLVPAGVLLLITSRGLLRRNRPAWRLAVGLLGLSVLLHLLRGPHYAAAVVTGLVTVALVARRDDYAFHGDPAARPSAVRRLLGIFVFTLGYGVAALWAYQTAADLPFSPYPALLDTLRAIGGQSPPDSDFMAGEFAEWFPLSVMSVLAIGVIWAAAVWVRPWRQRLFPDPRSREVAADIVRRWGGDTLAPFALRSDKEWFVIGQTLIAYRVVRGVALVSGDPVGPAGEAGPALRSFLAHAQARGWRTAVMGSSDRLLPAYREAGLRPLYHGDEAVVDTRRFCLEGRQMRAVRQAVHRLERKGFRAEVVMAGEVAPALRAELAAVEDSWLRGKARKGFTMELDSLFRLGGDDAAFVIGRDEQGRVSGFLHLAVCPASRSLSLSTMPRRPDTPNGFTAWLIVAAVSWARGHGFTELSLNFSPFAGLLTTQADLPSRQRLQRRALLRLKGVLALQLDNLQRFNGQFCPSWRPRYVILQAWADLPRVLVAAMAAEGYLPYASLIRGRDWSPAAGQAPVITSDPAPGQLVSAGPGPAQVPASPHRS